MVEKTFEVLPRFPELLEQGYMVSEVLGTQLYFTTVALPLLAQRCRHAQFTKHDRLLAIYFSLMVLTSYNIHSVTKKNLIGWLVSLACSIARAGVTRPWRCSTLMLEYYFGLLRTHKNTDALTVT
jgi:hypothetical protein